MALNEVFRDADGISLPVPTGTLSGTALRVGILNAVAITDEGSVTEAKFLNPLGQPQKTGGVGNADGFTSTKLSGAFRLQVTGALTAGQAVYITPAGALNATAASNFLFGAALFPKVGAGKAEAIVKILQPGQTTANA